jgi:hypothetical protein
MDSKKKGGIFIPPGIKPFPQPHEIYTARALELAGFYVEFVEPVNRQGAKTPDIRLDGERCEMKSPTGKLYAIERNLKRATKQSCKVVFDCRRMKLRDNDAIERELISRFRKQRQIARLLFVNRYGRVVDIGKKT